MSQPLAQLGKINSVESALWSVFYFMANYHLSAMRCWLLCWLQTKNLWDIERKTELTMANSSAMVARTSSHPGLAIVLRLWSISDASIYNMQGAAALDNDRIVLQLRV